ncbi:MAG: sigma 54-interacting transcriptional regulator, partial [Calditrichota bacterium]
MISTETNGNPSNSLRALVADDESLVRDFLCELLARKGLEAVACGDGQEAVEQLQQSRFNLVITDLRMPKLDGMALLRWILGNRPTIPVIMLTAFGTIEHAVEAIRTGAFDYVCKPVTDLEQFELSVNRALSYNLLLIENQSLKKEINTRYNFDQLVGLSPSMRRIFDLLATVAPTQATILVQGETGTGKELVAHAIHFNSPRANRPLIKVNCAALPEGLIESEMFGHDKGAFTGA